MIDFIHPRSKVNQYGLALALISFVIFGFGGFVTVNKVTEYRIAKQIASYDSSLPSGDYLLGSGLGEQPNDLKELLETIQEYQTALLPEDMADFDSTEQINDTTQDELVAESAVAEAMTDRDVVVAGIQYDENNINTRENIKPEKEVAAPPAVKEVIPDYNMIVIPKMGIKAVINEGKSADTLVKGVWRMPQGANPTEGGNTVITAHRYMYRPPDPRTFFLLDKLVPGDTFYIYWEGKRYDYKVRETKVVEPSEVSILYNTPNNQITLFSCTPLFTSDQRLVVIADEL